MNRRPEIDALRAIAFSLLILYHVGMLYVAGWDWHLKSTYTSEALQWPMLFVNRWRMDLIFLISGAATAFLMRRASRASFVRQRLWRLLLPLAFGMAVVIPIQPYCQGVANGLVEPGFLRFLGRYFTGYPWPHGAFDGWEWGLTWNHLWYLPYLLAYTVALAAIAPWLNSPRALRLRERFESLHGWHLLLYPALPLAVWTIALQRRFPPTHDLVNDWCNHANYFTVFLYGWLLADSERIWKELARLRRISLAGALAAFGILAGLALLRERFPWDGSLVVIWTVRCVYIWLAIATILGWGHAVFDRPRPWITWSTEAVYPWYILHQSLIVILAYWLVPLRLGAIVEPALVLVGTVGGCYLLHVVVIRNVSWLRPCFGLKEIPRRTGSGSLASAG
jgi:glucan biosynthesis protein C